VSQKKREGKLRIRVLLYQVPYGINNVPKYFLLKICVTATNAIEGFV